MQRQDFGELSPPDGMPADQALAWKRFYQGLDGEDGFAVREWPTPGSSGGAKVFAVVAGGGIAQNDGPTVVFSNDQLSTFAGAIAEGQYDPGRSGIVDSLPSDIQKLVDPHGSLFPSTPHLALLRDLYAAGKDGGAVVTISGRSVASMALVSSDKQVSYNIVAEGIRAKLKELLGMVATSQHIVIGSGLADLNTADRQAQLDHMLRLNGSNGGGEYLFLPTADKLFPGNPHINSLVGDSIITVVALPGGELSSYVSSNPRLRNPEDPGNHGLYFQSEAYFASDAKEPAMHAKIAHQAARLALDAGESSRCFRNLADALV